MVTVKNLTNSPYDLQSVKGFVRLPAFGEVSGDFTGEYLQLLEASMAVKVIDTPPKADRLDHDGDGKKGGSKPTEESDLTKLRADYQEVFGKRAYHGWRAEELQEKIDAKLAE
ncbi:hypothetical protein [Rhizobium gallicum]|uniref:hypothetical protein n=1 Tax=Rhizobium gallicum TaxID=56730 RepID=UPI001EF8F0FD|nr:hypothetical protein [Rhizobium gallicum]ULJ73601.1 hypothetical protein L2W42_08520 [Rhizobium gallicum]